MALCVNEKEIVVPGEVLATGMDNLPASGTFRDGDQIIASRLGIMEVSGRLIRIIPLSGNYLPKRGDTVIARVTDVTLSGWRMDINSPYLAMLSLKDATSRFIKKGSDLTQFFDLGDFVAIKIINVTTQKITDLSMRGPGLKKLPEGRIIYVTPSKVPRIIGKEGSMVSMVKKNLDCRILVGQNGVIWLNGSPKAELLAVETIRKIEREAHINGLTDRVGRFLEERLKQEAPSSVEK
ncbi:RNA-binding protein [Candidatus Woesearchaeota archaeon CG08_land_8_20_14_0_20_47_9]|nr:MAG: hypothetical protein AUJ69_02075 [Candidatus Woesearchaeota archaeon CG1_02_47_18]PIN73042.1 MAG: RNA-binding protein [Candidatus Woesearchaeota archaeon CG10_big_fil_rev_8_21_14_0_10_47_5]PIO03685.1 MAG: RNA-binding protein [Candidatus Woesearchaeota archaeon CG08_land_8_20_14_0_20_47_9]HII30105.1 RNA-binding protein [Candidatus Woesearchaeota archaeon]